MLKPISPPDCRADQGAPPPANLTPQIYAVTEQPSIVTHAAE